MEGPKNFETSPWDSVRKCLEYIRALTINDYDKDFLSQLVLSKKPGTFRILIGEKELARAVINTGTINPEDTAATIQDALIQAFDDLEFGVGTIERKPLLFVFEETTVH